MRAVERVLTICRRETLRFCRTPGTAGAYPLRTFSPIFFAAAARARALSGKTLALACPWSPIRPAALGGAAQSTTGGAVLAALASAAAAPAYGL
ncbi:hypothetical protein GA0070607_5053 [Micromonospora coriariae]|uniref:Uncharacterized protein n=1 Tax=Micromonospora coriariae TaxID=285665 RepID=A0A1C4XCH1_9ACTN|nr:hypothetical protein GA0070607_5053 [Micromonospora coriariae]